jgi:hypothetical protein
MKQLRTSQRGASTVHWLLALIPLLGVGALAIDLNNVYVSSAELQSAADAAALEGARLLYMPNGQLNISGYTDADGNAVPDALTAARTRPPRIRAGTRTSRSPVRSEAIGGSAQAQRTAPTAGKSTEAGNLRRMRRPPPRHSSIPVVLSEPSRT